MLVVKTPIYIANFPVDMRKSIDGLMLLAETHFASNITDGAYYVFGNKIKDKIKILYWDKNGFALWYKRLESERFNLIYSDKSEVTLSANQLQWLLSGLAYQNLQGHAEKSYDIFA